MRAWDSSLKQLIDLPTLPYIKEILELLATKNLIMQNGGFDCRMVENNYNISLIDALHTDTLELSHLVNENRSCGLKELGVSLFGDNAKAEQEAMKLSVTANGGVLTKDNYELYKGDAELIGRYGAKDAILTMKVFWVGVEQLLEQKLDKFFYEDESMSLLKGPTYQLNTTGLKVDAAKLQELRSTLEANCMEAKGFIYKQVEQYVAHKYPGTNKKNVFNIGSGAQLAWLLFDQLGNEFVALTKGGKELCRNLNLKIPYALKDKRSFITSVKSMTGQTYTARDGKVKKIRDYWNYLSSDKHTLAKFSDKYRWVEKLLYLTKEETILDTYVLGIQSKLTYGIIKPSFLQHGTTSGRYSSKKPNFQNLPRDDKRVKACIVARQGKVFVGADYAQLEPRVFASMSKDETLMSSFANGEDFYSVVGIPIFNKEETSAIKKDPNSFANLHPKLRDQAKVIALATPYGRTASFTASQLGLKRDEAQDLMHKYFAEYPKVELMMLESHEQAKSTGIVYNLFGRPRRIPEAKEINELYGTLDHSELPYEARTLLNLAMNHRIQSTGASIVNRAAIAFYNRCKELNWTEVRIVLQVHDQLITECPESLAEEVRKELKYCMEHTVELPGVELIADPVISKDLAGQK